MRSYFEKHPQAISLDLKSEDQDKIFSELVSLLPVDNKRSKAIRLGTGKREELGPTTIGNGVAVPHCRSFAVNKLVISYGRKVGGIDLYAYDRRPVEHFFLIVAPPIGPDSELLTPMITYISSLVKAPGTVDRLNEINSNQEFIDLIYPDFRVHWAEGVEQPKPAPKDGHHAVQA